MSNIKDENPNSDLGEKESEDVEDDATSNSGGIASPTINNAPPAVGNSAPGDTSSPSAITPQPIENPQNGASDQSSSTSGTFDPNTNTVSVVGHAAPLEDAIQRKLDNIAFSNDLAGGKITPETYQDLFAKKDTLGKIGTLFGLLVSGAGSGLNHQPNAVLEMMNNQIKNDLEAQKTNQGNRHNWYSLAMNQEKNNADVNYTNAVAEATRTGNWSKALEAERYKYGNQRIPGLNDMSASTEAQNNSLSAAVQNIQNTVNNSADGQAKTIAQNKIDTVLKPALISQISQNQDQLAQKKAAINAMYPDPMTKVQMASNPRGPAVNKKLLQDKIDLGRMAPGIAGSIPEGQVQLVNQEIKNTELNRNGYADWLDSFNNLQNMRLAGQVPGANAGRALLTGAGTAVGAITGGLFGAGAGTALGSTASHGAADLQNAFERARNIQSESLKQRIGTNLNADEKDQLINSLLPAWSDSEATRKEAFRKGVQHFKSLEATPNLDQYGLKTPFPEVPYVSQKTGSSNSTQNTSESKKELGKDIPAMTR